MIGCMICGVTFYPGICDSKDILLNRHTWKKTYSIAEIFNVKENIKHIRNVYRLNIM